MIDVYYGKNEYKTEGLKPSVFPLLRQIPALLFYTSGSLAPYSNTFPTRVSTAN